MRAMRVRLITLILLAALALGGCATEEPAAPAIVEPAGLVTYVHPGGLFTLSLPPDWVVSDISTAQAVQVAFSPPGSPDPAVSVYVVDAAALGALPALEATDAEGEITVAMDTLLDAYGQVVYGRGGATAKEIDRVPQPDGSVRMRYVVDAPNRTTQHNDFVEVQGPYLIALRTVLPAEPGLLRTVSRVVNTLTVDPTASVPGLAGGGGLADGQVISFSSLNTWLDTTGGYVIAGQVRNQAEQPLEFVRVTATLVDEEGEPTGERDNFVAADVIPPGGYAPFRVVFSDGMPRGTARYDLSATARFTDLTTASYYGQENFLIASDVTIDSDGALVVSGNVRNEGSRPAQLVKVIVTIFDDARRVVATDATLVETQSLAPGDASPFSLRFFDTGGQPQDYLVVAQGVLDS